MIYVKAAQINYFVKQSEKHSTKLLHQILEYHALSCRANFTGPCSAFAKHRKQTHNRTAPLTSSGMSLVSGWPWAARRAMAPVRILLRLIWRSGGGPPRGWPRTMMAQPDKTWSDNNKEIELEMTNSTMIANILKYIYGGFLKILITQTKYTNERQTTLETPRSQRELSVYTSCQAIHSIWQIQ